ncbi:hypothetical protein ACHQM5_023945 [Ranunculus cassubicifolius]
MADLTKNPKSPPQLITTFPLPPGFRFHPTDSQILSHHLPIKNNNPNNTNPNVISEIDLYNYDPFDLPEIDSFPYGYRGSKKHWYYFSLGNPSGVKRKSKGGFWKRKCRTRNVMEGGLVLGTKTSFVFYRRGCRDDDNERTCCRTNWIMIEYALVDHQMDLFVLCRVFLKARPANRVLKASSLNPHTEDLLTAKENCFADIPYTQQEMPSASGIGEVVATREDAFDNDAINFPQQLQPITELNDNSADEVRSFYDCSGVRSSLGMVSGSSFDDVVAAELRTNTIFLEGDYLELDDLVGPILGFGS